MFYNAIVVETILQTKLHVPLVRPNSVPRPRLIRRLNQGLRQGARLSLVSAPAGYGKTSLVAEWIHRSRAEKRPLHFAWLSLDDSHNNPHHFLRYVATALRTILPALEDAPLDLLRSSQPGVVESILVAMVNDMAGAVDGSLSTERRYILVLDDYHLIEAQAAHDIPLFLLSHAPPGLHLVVIGRAEPPWSLARLRASSQITELRRDDLTFTLDETALFLNNVMGLALSPADQALMRKRTEGWIAGLQLAALSMEGLDWQGQRDFILEFAGSNRYIVEYLASEVLARRPEGTNAFLLQTSILERLSAQLCDAVTARSDSQDMLELLEGANLFLVALDDERRWFRYHHLFSDLLRKRLEQTWPALVPELHRRASAWYEARGTVGLAIEHALAAGEGDRAAGIIASGLERIIMGGDFISLLRWLDALPRAVLHRQPQLNTYYAIFLLITGRPVEEVEARMQEAFEADPAGLLRGELALLQAILAMVRGDSRRGYALSHQALELLPEENQFLRGLLFRNLASVFKLTGDVQAATWAIEESARLARKTGDRLGSIVTIHQKAEMCVLRGQLHEALALCRQVLEEARAAEELSAIAIRALVTMANLFREWDDLDAAGQRLTQAIELAERWIELWAMGAYIALAYLRQAQGDTDGVHDAFQVAWRMAAAYDLSQVDDLFVAAHQARLWLAQGNLDGVERWARERGVEGDEQTVRAPHAPDSPGAPYHLRELELTTAARLFLAQDRPDAALTVLAPLAATAGKLGRTGSVIEMVALQAIAHGLRGDDAQASSLLKRALSLAEPGGYVRLFADMGEPMERLLRHEAMQKGPGDYMARLLSAFGPSPVARPKPSPSQPLVDPLSDRELEVLRLLTTHMSSTEIAAELGISANTVRFHTKNIYSKLNVHRRADAVLLARDLTLL